MFGFLGFLLFIFVLIVLIGFTILGNILRVLFGFGRRGTHYQDHTYTDQRQNTYSRTESRHEENYTEDSSSSSSSSQKRPKPSGSKKKIFDDDEGEYVDYEEVK